MLCVNDSFSSWILFSNNPGFSNLRAYFLKLEFGHPFALLQHLPQLKEGQKWSACAC